MYWISIKQNTLFGIALARQHSKVRKIAEGRKNMMKDVLEQIPRAAIRDRSKTLEDAGSRIFAELAKTRSTAIGIMIFSCKEGC
ncbi:MAG: hypothetical protein EOP45_08390 [Sphingobacteriaceae bacterium]|nr:MAG: hypothetical protein EOP45_08390 [Sphingobacteriaceae bacterium]